MEFREGQSGCDRSVGAPTLGSPPLPAPLQTETLIDLEPVFFRYALSAPIQAGALWITKRRIEFRASNPLGPARVLAKKDHTAPHLTAPGNIGAAANAKVVLNR